MTEFRLAVPDDAEQLIEMREAAFGLPMLPPEASREVDGEMYVVADGPAVLGVLRVHRWAQWFGGRAVSSAGISSVTVRPEARGRGVGKQLVGEVLAHLREEGFALSSLYPSTVAPYRRSGYELAGSRTRYELRLLDLPLGVTGTVEAWGDDQLDEIMACYGRFAAVNNGLYERSEGVWKGLRAPITGHRAYCYLVREAGDVTGYVVYTHETETDGPIGYRYHPGDTPYNYAIVCRDLVAMTREAAETLVSHLAASRAMATRMRWTGPTNDPMNELFPALAGRVDGRAVWMLRVVDVPAALEARGYPIGLDAAIDFRVVDRTVAANDRCFRLEVSGGTGKVAEIDIATTEIDVTALASLYSSWYAPSDAVRSGGLRGASPADLSALQQAFSGPPPWSFEFF